MKKKRTFHQEAVKSSTIAQFKGDELAANVWMSKYALKSKEGEYVELSPNDMFWRLAREFARIERKYPNPISEADIYEHLNGFKKICCQGSPMYGIGNDYTVSSLSNCVVADSPGDSVSSIFTTGKDLANLFKRRCGVGIDISTLRPENAPVNNSAKTTTGAWSFADFYSNASRMIGQNGRRAALMIGMDIRHPDIEKFVTMKKDLTKVTGANISVKISDEFMKAVKADSDFELKFPVDSSSPSVARIIKAKELWELIVKTATDTAEPGILLWDNLTGFLPAHEYFVTLITNPCGEVGLSAYDSCRLMSINIKNFVKDSFTSGAHFDFTAFAKTVRVAMRLSDDLVELEIEKLKSIISKVDEEDEKVLWSKLLKAAQDGRRTGLGTHGLADALACLGLPYDSQEALKVIDKIYKTLRNSAYSESVELSKERGTFPVFDWDKEKDNLFIKALPKNLRDKIKKYGRRNISILTNAPTGSVSILSQTSSGIEPVFRNAYTRRRKLSHNEQGVKPDFVDESGDRWVEYEVYHHNVKEFLKRFNTSTIPDFFITSDLIDWERRIQVQATIQQYIDHSISSTINLPKGTPPEVVGNLYLKAWKLGLKGVTVYVEGSRDGVLVSKKEESIFPQNHSPRRPVEVECDINHTTIKGEKWMILVGLVDGKPFEILGGIANVIELPSNYTRARLKKNEYKTKNNTYDLVIGENGDTLKIKDVVRLFDNPHHAAVTRLISLSLRHGAKIEYVCQQLMKGSDSDIHSFAKCIARVLKRYIRDGDDASDGKNCPECGGEKTLIYQEGCVLCARCGWSRC